MANYINKYQTIEAYNADTSKQYPNVSLVAGELVYDATEPIDYSTHYLTFTALDSGSFDYYSNDENGLVSYSSDNGATWSTPSMSVEVQSVASGDVIMWKGTYDPSTVTGTSIGQFYATGNFNVEGNIMSLVYGDNFTGQTASVNLQSMFADNYYIISAENLVLPATTLTQACYSAMFQGCQNLTTAPALPATTLANYCYGDMFVGCTSLTTAPELPATTLVEGCYSGMFYGCTSLVTAPELPATTLAESCYAGMFNGCESLTTAPVLSATTLVEFCYSRMFNGCTSLTTAPELPATTLAESCYYEMFRDCTSLTTAPELSATTLAESCYAGMFNGCEGISHIKCLATDISATNCTTNWVDDVASTGTFTKAKSMRNWQTGVDGIPTGWTIENAS